MLFTYYFCKLINIFDLLVVHFYLIEKLCFQIFAKNILAILQDIKAREDGKGAARFPAAVPGVEPPRPLRPAPQPAVYNR